MIVYIFLGTIIIFVIIINLLIYLFTGFIT